MERQSERLAVILKEIAAFVDQDPHQHWSDEHVRWELYQRALEVDKLHGALREALAVEPDEGVASSVVLLAFGRVPDLDRMLVWVNALPERHRGFVEKMAHESAVLRSLCDGSFSGDIRLDEWTHWLQRQAAELAVVRRVLVQLARDGQTRKIRNIAGERLRVGDRRVDWADGI